MALDNTTLKSELKAALKYPYDQAGSDPLKDPDQILDEVVLRMVNAFEKWIKTGTVTVNTGTLLTPPPTVALSDGGATLFATTLIPSINSQDIEGSME